MNDKIALRLYFRTDFYVGNERDGYQMTKGLLDLDLKNVGSRDVYKDDDGKVKHRILYHPYETLPTSYTGMAFKIFHEGMKTGKGDKAIHYPPFIELKCSPAKILQGHNIFGTDKMRQGVIEMLGWLHIAVPQVFQLLDIENAEILQIDVTYSARLKDDNQVDKALQFVRNISSRGIRKSEDRKETYRNTVYFGSKRCKRLARKIYGKNCEFQDQLKEQLQLAKKNDKSAMRVVEVMQDAKLQEWCKGLLRFEVGMKAYWLKEQGLSTKLSDLLILEEQNPNFLQELWIKAQAEFFKALEGQYMNIQDYDGIYQLLCTKYQSITRSGKISYTRAKNLLRFYRDLENYGCKQLKKEYSESQYYKLMSDLIDAGISKAVLQNLYHQKDENIIKFVELIKIDFDKQVPDWWEEPVSTFSFNLESKPQTKLKLVS